MVFGSLAEGLQAWESVLRALDSTFFRANGAAGRGQCVLTALGSFFRGYHHGHSLSFRVLYLPFVQEVNGKQGQRSPHRLPDRAPKRLLGQNELIMGEIASCIGYADANY